MRRVYVVLELQESSTFDPSDDAELDDLAEDLLVIRHGVSGATVFSSLSDLVEEAGEPEVATGS